MGLEQVIDDILTAGDEQRRKIAAEAAAERQKILNMAWTEAESAKNERKRSFELKSTMMRQQAISSAELEAKKRTLHEQNAILTRMKRDVLQSLSALETAQRKEILDKLVRIGSKRFSRGTIHCRKEDERIVAPPSGFRKEPDLNAAGGILIESEDKAYQIDLTFEVLLDDVWTKKVREIYGQIFGGA